MSDWNSYERQIGIGKKPLILIIGVVLIALFGILFAKPYYNVWQQGLEGEAALAKANQTRQVLIAQANAEKEAAAARADAIRIVGQAAKDYPEYRQQEFMGAFAEALQNGNINQVVYVPTEANIPIMEASRLKN